MNLMRYYDTVRREGFARPWHTMIYYVNVIIADVKAPFTAILSWQQITHVRRRSPQLRSSYLSGEHNYSRKSISSFIDAIEIPRCWKEKPGGRGTLDRIYEHCHVTRFRAQSNFGTISCR